MSMPASISGIATFILSIVLSVFQNRKKGASA